MVFDKAYVNFAHLFELSQRGVFWVSRPKENLTPERTEARLPFENRAAMKFA